MSNTIKPIIKECILREQLNARNDDKFPKFYNIKYTKGYPIDKYVRFCCKSY